MIDFYRKTNGFEMQLEPNCESNDLIAQLDCIRFDEIDFIIEMLPSNAEQFPGVFVIGSDAATNRVALDLRTPPLAPVIVFRADEEPYLHTSRIIGASFAEFLDGEEMRTAIN